MNCNGWLGWVLKYRFTHVGMFLEKSLCDMLGHRWFGGDRVSWDICRTNLYEYWLEGWSEQDILDTHDIPSLVLHNWFTIWDAYYNAWRFIDEEKSENVHGRGNSKHNAERRCAEASER